MVVEGRNVRAQGREVLRLTIVRLMCGGRGAGRRVGFKGYESIMQDVNEWQDVAVPGRAGEEKIDRVQGGSDGRLYVMRCRSEAINGDRFQGPF